jgi:small subunit ribosomal protein S17
MAEEEKDEQTPEEPQAEEAREQPEPEAEAPEQPELEAEAPEQPEPEPDAEAEEPAAAEAAPAGETEAPEALSPRQQRKLARSRFEGEAGAPRSAEGRALERAQARSRKAALRRAHRLTAREKARRRREAQPPAEAPEPAPRPTGKPKVRQGVVVSDRADKTITVRVDLTRRHRLYEKTIRSSSTLHAHDERNEANIGDTVRVVESRPLSRTKRWRLVEVLERAR